MDTDINRILADCFTSDDDVREWYASLTNLLERHAVDQWVRNGDISLMQILSDSLSGSILRFCIARGSALAAQEYASRLKKIAEAEVRDNFGL